MAATTKIPNSAMIRQLLLVFLLMLHPLKVASSSKKETQEEIHSGIINIVDGLSNKTIDASLHLFDKPRNLNYKLEKTTTPDTRSDKIIDIVYDYSIDTLGYKNIHWFNHDMNMTGQHGKNGKSGRLGNNYNIDHEKNISKLSIHMFPTKSIKTNDGVNENYIELGNNLVDDLKYKVDNKNITLKPIENLLFDRILKNMHSINKSIQTGERMGPISIEQETKNIPLDVKLINKMDQLKEIWKSNGAIDHEEKYVQSSNKPNDHVTRSEEITGINVSRDYEEGYKQSSSNPFNNVRQVKHGTGSIVS
ncbi:unnamed protein product, partial [Meganyctiphanes norvegica]